VSPQVRPHALFASPPPPLSRETTLSSSGYVRSACPACLLLRIVGDDCVCVWVMMCVHDDVCYQRPLVVWAEHKRQSARNLWATRAMNEHLRA
jgi:hypothetical protein